MAQKSIILALDYGGTKHSAAVAEIGGRQWLAHDKVFSPPGADAQFDKKAMLKLARKVLKKAGGELAAVGVSFGGAVDGLNGLVLLSHHVAGWENTQLRDQLQREFHVPAAVGNDAQVAGLGEYQFGAGRGFSSLLYVTVSTGIGGGWVLDGKIWNGADGMAGQIGHVVVRPGGAKCVCGKRGCLEAEACGPGIALKMRNRKKLKPTAKMTCEMVSQAALQGDKLAQEVMDDAATMLGIGLGGAITLMNPQRVVLGGGVTKSGERWWRIVREIARERVLPEMRVDLQPAALGDDAPLWGAVALAEDML